VWQQYFFKIITSKNLQNGSKRFIQFALAAAIAVNLLSIIDTCKKWH